jgi:predicted ester cyclase
MPEDTLEYNKSIVRRMLHAFNTGDTAVVAELIDRNVVDHGRKLGLESTIRRSDPIRRVRTEILRQEDVFPDKEFKEVVMVAEGDTVVLVWSMTGTNRGSILGRQPTGKRVETQGIEIVRIRDGKIIEHRDDGAHVFDILFQLDLLDTDLIHKLRTGDRSLGERHRTAPVTT